MRYACRRLEVGREHEPVGPGPPPARSRIHDTAGALIELVGAPGEHPAAFAARRATAVTERLAALGRQGWRVLYYTPAVLRSPVGGEAHIAPWPVGTHLLVRAEPETPSPERAARRRELAEELRRLAAALRDRPGC